MPGLIGIGVGPGDVELLTVKAVKAIQNADIIMCPASNEDRPSIALAVVSPIMDKSTNQKQRKAQRFQRKPPSCSESRTGSSSRGDRPVIGASSSLTIGATPFSRGDSLRQKSRSNVENT